MKLHQRIRFDGDPVPDKATITEARKSDKSQLESLIVEDEDALNVFDRGYLDYKQFDRYCKEGIRFVTRLKNNACVEVLRELEIDEESVIEEDLIVRLGKGKNRMEYDLRLVITKDTEGKAVDLWGRVPVLNSDLVLGLLTSFDFFFISFLLFSHRLFSCWL